MDLTDTIIPNSAQINAEDLLSRPVTVTITAVESGNAEQPVYIHLAEFVGRTYRPGKSMRRVLVAAWDAEASAYVGRRLTLYNDPTIRFGKDITGGIRISHMSHITKPLNIALTVTRGKRAPFVVQPLPAERDWLTELEDAGNDPDLIRALGTAAKNAHAPADVMAKLTAAYNAAKATETAP